MAIKGISYFYDEQQIRYLQQIVKAFSGFQYMTGKGADGQQKLVTVPCQMALTSKQVANILLNQSENTLMQAPMISVHQTGLVPAPEALQNPDHVDTRQVVERFIDPATGMYDHGRGKSYTIQRLMPRPFNMTFQVDIWTSNMEQKYQLLEQIATIMYPSFDIQNSDNALDWSAKTTIYLEEIIFTSKSQPIGGTDSELEVATINFRMPMWLSPPAKVTEQRLIEQINTNIADSTLMQTLDQGITPDYTNYLESDITSPGNHYVRLEGNRLFLLGAGHNMEVDPSGNPYSWLDLINLYGVVTENSRIILKTNPDSNMGIVGTIEYDPNNVNELIFTIDQDTITANTLEPVNGLINPTKTNPVSGLPSPQVGDRYLLLDGIGYSVAWGNLTANYGDIIQYDGSRWNVVFNASLNGHTTQYVKNLASGSQLKWEDSDWVFSYDTVYPNGYWRFLL